MGDVEIFGVALRYYFTGSALPWAFFTLGLLGYLIGTLIRTYVIR